MFTRLPTVYGNGQVKMSETHLSITISMTYRMLYVNKPGSMCTLINWDSCVSQAWRYASRTEKFGKRRELVQNRNPFNCVFRSPNSLFLFSFDSSQILFILNYDIQLGYRLVFENVLYLD